jgi:hypothetical protein
MAFDLFEYVSNKSMNMQKSECNYDEWLGGWVDGWVD